MYKVNQCMVLTPQCNNGSCNPKKKTNKLETAHPKTGLTKSRSNYAARGALHGPIYLSS
uniref:Uncharacterized protein n=1 Tax=Manihot esculenta TaxID=3983 RepID=A0A2C9U455_MANES